MLKNAVKPELAIRPYLLWGVVALPCVIYSSVVLLCSVGFCIYSLKLIVSHFMVFVLCFILACCSAAVVECLADVLVQMIVAS